MTGDADLNALMTSAEMDGLRMDLQLITTQLSSSGHRGQAVDLLMELQRLRRIEIAAHRVARIDEEFHDCYLVPETTMTSLREALKEPDV